MIDALLDISVLRAKLAKVHIHTREPLDKLVNDQARLFITSSGKVPGMVQVTPPFHQGATASQSKKVGIGALRRDIYRVYATAGMAFGDIKQTSLPRARAFWACLQKGEYTRAEAILRASGLNLRCCTVGPFDGGQEHWRRRDHSTGKVRGKIPSMVVTDAPVLREYIKKTEGHVGRYGSGFNDAASQLGGKGVPDWMQRHGSRFSGISFQRTEHSFHISMDNRVPFGQSDTRRRMRYVLHYRSEALRRSLPYIIRAIVKKAQLAA